MAIQDSDLLYVQRPSGVDAGGYKLEVGDLLNSPVTVSESAPADPSEGDLWWADTDTDDGGGRLYTYTGEEWVDVSIPGGALTEGEGDTRYLSRLSDDTAQGSITFQGMTRHQAGVKVSGGTAADVVQGLYTDNKGIKVAAENGAGEGEQVLSVHHGGLSATPRNVKNNCFSLTGTFTENITDAALGNLFRSVGFIEDGKSVDYLTHFRAFVTGPESGTGIVKEHTGFYADRSLGNPASGKVGTVANYGFLSDLQETDGVTSYNFYAQGTAPNYFGGLTQHNGGVRVTGDKIELGPSLDNSSGTASFTSLSDSVFTKKTLYDADYGDFLANYRFLADVFRCERTISPTSPGQSIGTTRVVESDLNLTSGGLDHNTATKRISGIYSKVNFTNLFDNTALNNDEEMAAFWAQNLSQYNQWNTTANRESRSAGFVYWNPIENPETNSGYVSKHAVGFACRDIGRNHHNLTGFASDVNTATNANNYNFYASGNAPNLFLGETTINGNTSGYVKVKSLGTACPSLELVRTNAANSSQNAIEVWSNNKADSVNDLQWRVSWGGDASFRSISGALADVQIQMDADDPTAYTTTFVVDADEEGNEVTVENSNYVGTTESLLDIIRDLRARVAALEGGTN